MGKDSCRHRFIAGIKVRSYAQWNGMVWLGVSEISSISIQMLNHEDNPDTMVVSSFVELLAQVEQQLDIYASVADFFQGEDSASRKLRELSAMRILGGDECQQILHRILRHDFLLFRSNFASDASRDLDRTPRVDDCGGISL